MHPRLCAALCTLLSTLFSTLLVAFAGPTRADQIQPFIIGGEEASGDWPWAALVEIDFGSQYGFCSGSLLSPDWVLTAAHCFHDDDGNWVGQDTVTVYIGSRPLGQNTPVPAAGYQRHPGYGGSPPSNDIALVRLSSPVSGTPLPSLVDQAHFDALAALDAAGRDEAITAIGWGVTDLDSQAVSSTLQQVQLDYVPFSTCNSAWNGGLNTTMVCAAELNPGDNETENTCLGDSGGPLFLGLDPAPYIVGVTSFGSDDNCQAGQPTVFARVLALIDFVESSSGSANQALVDVAITTGQERYYRPLGGNTAIDATVGNNSLSNTADNVTVHLDSDGANAQLQWDGCDSTLPGSSSCTLSSPLASGDRSQGRVNVSHTSATATAASLTLSVDSDEDEYRVKNNQQPVTVIFSNQPDLTVTAEQTAGDLDGSGQGVATVAVRVTNLSDLAGAGDTVVQLNPPVGTTAHGDGTVQCDTLCEVGPIAAGASVAFTLTLTSGTPDTGTLTLTTDNLEGGDFPQDNNQHQVEVTYSSVTAASNEGGNNSGGGSSGGGGALSGWWLLLGALAGLARLTAAYPPCRNSRSR